MNFNFKKEKLSEITGRALMDWKKLVQFILLSFLCFFAAFTIITDITHNHPAQASFAVNSSCIVCVHSLSLCDISATGLEIGILPEFWAFLTLLTTKTFLVPSNSSFLRRAPPLVWIQNIHIYVFKDLNLTKGDAENETYSKNSFFH